MTEHKQYVGSDILKAPAGMYWVVISGVDVPPRILRLAHYYAGLYTAFVSEAGTVVYWDTDLRGGLLTEFIAIGPIKPPDIVYNHSKQQCLPT